MAHREVHVYNAVPLHYLFENNISSARCHSLSSFVVFFKGTFITSFNKSAATASGTPGIHQCLRRSWIESGSRVAVLVMMMINDKE